MVDVHGMIERIEDFTSRRRWAVVGASRDPDKYGHRVFASLLRAGYEAYGVNPNTDEILERPVYPALAHLPVEPEVVSVVVAPSETERVVPQCAELGLTRVWLQPGAESADAVRFCRENGIQVVWDVCVIGYRRRWHQGLGPALQP